MIFKSKFIFLGDFVLLSRKDLEKVGLLTRASFQIFEELLQSLKHDAQVILFFFYNVKSSLSWLLFPLL